MSHPKNQSEDLILKKRSLPEDQMIEEEKVSKVKQKTDGVDDSEVSEETGQEIEKPESQKKPAQDKKIQKKEETEEEVKTEEKEVPKPKQEEPKKETTGAKIRGQKASFSHIGMGQDRVYFIENLAMLLSSGMSIITALNSIEAGVKSRGMKNIIKELKSEVNEGIPVWRAIDNTRLLSAHSISLIKIGEESGRLPANLKVIAIQNQKERMFKSKVTSALLYPVIVLFFTLIVGIGIAWFILPKLSGTFKSLDLKLPVTTKILLSFGDFLDKNGMIVVPVGLILLSVLFYFIFFFGKTKFLGQKIIFRIPGIGTLIQQVELSRFGFVLGTLLSAGMPLVNALASLEEISGYFAFKKFYIFLKKNIELGNSFKKSFISYKHSDRLIPFPVQQMIVAAEQSGGLEDTLLAIGNNFEEKTDITTKNLSAILEPILLFVIWAVVVFVALSVITPIYSLLGGIHN
ncbi:MAG: type II secretion system F family protein [bacterium]